MKGTCHIFVNGEGTDTPSDAVDFVYWDSTKAPESDDLVKDRVYILLQDCMLGENKGVSGEYWQYDGSLWKKLVFETIS